MYTFIDILVNIIQYDRDRVSTGSIRACSATEHIRPIDVTNSSYYFGKPHREVFTLLAYTWHIIYFEVPFLVELDNLFINDFLFFLLMILRKIEIKILEIVGFLLIYFICYSYIC